MLSILLILILSSFSFSLKSSNCDKLAADVIAGDNKGAGANSKEATADDSKETGDDSKGAGTDGKGV